MEIAEEYLSLEYTCRTCLKKNEIESLIPIFESQIIEILDGFSFFKLKIRENDGLPQSICDDCMQKLCRANEFRASCEKSQDVLERYFLTTSQLPVPGKEGKCRLTIEFMNIDMVNTKEEIEHDIKTEVDDDTEEFDATESDFLEQNENEEDPIFACKLCNTLFKKQHLLHQHMNEIHRISTTNDEVNSSEDENTDKILEKITQNSKIKSNFCCRYKCTKGYKSIELLNEHKMKMHYCKICGKYFKKLDQHIQTHSDEKTFICDICSGRFKTALTLERHRENHETDRRYKCKYCKKSFAQKPHKDTHERTHTGERPFLCTICGKAFIDQSGLRIHTICQHTGERPHKCDQCDRAFITKGQLHYHGERVHSAAARVKQSMRDAEERKHLCLECGNSFKRAEHLKLHMKRVHLKQKPFTCEICGKGFTIPSDLKPHMLVHTRERPHSCPFCPRKFNLAKSMRDHAMRIHKTILHP